MIDNFEQYFDEVVALRRYFHENPELGFQEYKTQEFIIKYLTDLGLEPYKIASTGVVALIHGKEQGKTLLLRSDMDALPIQETNTFSFTSKNEGVMHACGHDGHMAMLLVAAKIIVKNKEHIHGTVKLVFQPNEEADGASFVIKEGVLENPKVNSSFAIHLWSPIPSGKIGLKSGAVMAEMYNFKITLKGKGGHTSAPQHGIDPIICAANVIQSVQIMQTREIDPMDATVVVFGKINGGSQSNIIAEKVEMEGTLRYLYDGGEEGEQQPIKRFQRIVKSICQAHRVVCDIQFMPSNYIVLNDEESVAFLKKEVLPHVVESENIIPYCCMGGEDFSEFTSHNNIPGALVFVGTGNSNVGSDKPHHRNDFTIDENTLLTGVKIHVYTALQYLSK
ncbi:amidohydrolase [Clostridium sp. MD294]|uniref:M20 metallopeptidase family protein n=1 Tax=Clostridium sp. MD294 TaxID=97138 RepID=UPI0002CB1739|nr:amidohydrolase [Clostridium sp. MD294]NDO45941.1 amidohydrolase [Clostridium sp. MD294]USF30400.1 N-acetylcysteine deacetylase [Clostridium sp. MD294]